VTLQAFKVKFGQRIICSHGLGSMGFGLPMAIGACLALQQRRTICVEGDGSFQLNMQELATIHRLNLPIKIFVLDNGGYASIARTQKGLFGETYSSSDLGFPDLEKIAMAYNIPYFCVADNSSLADTIQLVIHTAGPVICDVKLSDQPTQPRVLSHLVDGVMVTDPMEDMWPYLDREEFERNML
jgi:acetolactate synthase-1/2/3 large subunit